MSDAKDLIDQILNRRPRGPRSVTPPGGNWPTVQPKAFIAGLAVLLVVWAALSSLYTVQPEERAVIKRFGRVTGIADPGLHFKLPFGVDAVQIVATERVLKQEFGFRTESSDDPRSQFAGGYPDESLMLTGDLNIIQVEWVVQYQINDAVQFLYGMREPTKTLRDLSESVMRRVVGNRIGSDVLTVGRIEIANTARDEIQEAMERYDNGIRVIAVQLQDVVPPQRVQPAFNEVNEARQELERMVNDATRQANEAVPRADGRAWVATDTLKNVLVMLRHPDGTREPLAIGLPGDREVDLKRLEAQVSPAEVEAFVEDDFKNHPLVVKGYLGPGVLGTEGPTGIRYLLDPRVSPGTAWITGANEPGRHVFDLVAGRDFVADGYVEAAQVLEGDPAPDGSGPLSLARGIEMGHIFQLGRKYADALDLQVLDENGKLVTVTMGSYGIGVSRAVAAIAESSYDDRGLIWPREVAPADVHVVMAGKSAEIKDTAELIAAGLDASGVSVILDDRNASVGVKFADAELLGVPTICVVGRGVADGVVEVRDRASGEKTEVSLAEAAEHLRAVVRG